MSFVQQGVSEFSGWRAYLWPIHNYELKKLLPMLGLFFLITLNYNILRVLKDVCVIHAKGSGAEVIPFIKVWVLLPGAFFMTFLFTRLSNRFSRDRVFYLITSLFLSFFALYAFFLYPYADSLYIPFLSDSLERLLPSGAQGFVIMTRNWTSTLFYVMSELWGTMILFVLLWGFANQVTKLGEAKRFYGLFGIGTNFSGVVAGQVSVYLSRGAFNPALPFGTNAWEQSMVLLISLVILSGIATLALFYWMQTRVLTDPRFYDPRDSYSQKKKKKSQFSMRDNFSYLIHSPYLLSIAIIVCAYNIDINLLEVLWKQQAKELYSDPNTYNLYMNEVSSLIGMVATLAALFISGNSIRYCGWTLTAMLTPAILLLTSVGFFGFFFLKDVPELLPMATFGITPLAMVVFFGSAQNILCRGAKYSLFDATKEMSFIPLSSEEKVKGKAAIDGVCSRLGKAGGSFIQQGLLLFFGSLSASAPYIAFSLLTIALIWSGAVYYLGTCFSSLSNREPIRLETGEQESAQELALAAISPSPLSEPPSLQEQSATV